MSVDGYRAFLASPVMARNPESRLLFFSLILCETASSNVPMPDRRIDLCSLILPCSYTTCNASDIITPGTVYPLQKMQRRPVAISPSIPLCRQRECIGVVFATGMGLSWAILLLYLATKFKLTNLQREVWFFLKIISAVALGLLCISMIIWVANLKKKKKAFFWA